jgi:hypothetical protein
MILIIDPRKAFDKVKHPFMIKVLKKLGIEGVLINIIKVIYDKLRANTMEKLCDLHYFPVQASCLVFNIQTLWKAIWRFLKNWSYNCHMMQ